MIIPSKRRTFKRFAALAASPRYTQTRFLMYEALHGISLKGAILDIGGTNHSKYYSLMHLDGPVTKLNVSNEHDGGCDIQHDCNLPLPFADASFDHVLSLNTFEHVRHYELAIAEALRVCKAGGTFLFQVPYLYRVHGVPYDYTRLTPQYWEELLREMGLSSEKFFIEPLVWDNFATGASFFERSFPRWLRPLVRGLFLLPGLFTEAFPSRKRKRRREDDYAVAFSIRGQK